MKIYIIAGENSSDFIGSLLMQALTTLAQKSRHPLYFLGVGGHLMNALGLRSLFPMEQINIMGFVEIVGQIFKLKQLIQYTADDIISENPDILVTIDSPGFTYRVAKKVSDIAPHIKLVHIVAPSVWAYKPGRALKYAKLYDQLLTLLPFEPQYFTKHGLATHFIGHPILEQKFYTSSQELKNAMNIATDAKIIAITPGSRRSEIARHMPIIKDALEKLSLTSKIHAIFIQPNEYNISFISGHLNDVGFSYHFTTERLKAFAISDCALAKSGTNTIEITASGTPMIVFYKLNSISFYFLKMFLKVKYASLINILANREIIPEYIQSECTADNIVYAISELLANKNKALAQVKVAQKFLLPMGLGSEHKPSEKAAQIIFDLALKK